MAAGVECDKQGQMNKREGEKGRCDVGGDRRWRRFKQGEAQTDACLKTMSGGSRPCVCASVNEKELQQESQVSRQVECD